MIPVPRFLAGDAEDAWSNAVTAYPIAAIRSEVARCGLQRNPASPNLGLGVMQVHILNSLYGEVDWSFSEYSPD
jgi:hypothetical protein